MVQRRNSQHSAASGEFTDFKPSSQPSQDAFLWMSAARVSESLSKEEDPSIASGGGEGSSLPPSYPLPLVLFVCLLAVMGGLVVTGVHYMILFSGCPLGINGCNEFTPEKEEYGFFLIRALKDSMPEDVIYIIAAVIGGLIFAQMCVRLPEHLTFQITGGGTLQGLVAVASGQRISLTAAGLRIVASCVFLGSGGTLGMDGPAIQVCTAVTTFSGWALGMRGVQTQSLLASLGFAAGFAASFNAPLAGIMFAMEELSHASPNLSRHIICIILMVSAVATAVARLFYGNNELLQTQWSVDLMNEVGGGSLNTVFGMHMWMLVSIPIALVCSFFGHLTSIVMRRLRKLTLTLSLQHKVPFTVLVIVATGLQAAVGSGVFRATGLRGVWGIGYESLQKAFDQEHSISDFFIFAAGKALATTLVLAVRAPGDLLEPIIIVGAFLGGGMGRILQTIAEDNLEHRVMQPCLVFGMVAFFASCFRFPLTPVLIVLEVTGVDAYALVLPAALAAFTAVTISNRLYLPFLDTIMEEDGISLHELSANALLNEDMDDAISEEGDEPEPEEDRPSQHSCGNSEHSFAPSIATHGSHASARLRAVVRNMESCMISLSSPPKSSRSSSRANSNTSRQSPASGPTSGNGKSNNFLAVPNSRGGESNSSRAHSKAPSEAHSIGCISLNIPISEYEHSIREKRGSRLNTSASDRSNCDSSICHSEIHEPLRGANGMTSIVPSGVESSLHAYSVKTRVSGKLPQAPGVFDTSERESPEIRQIRERSISFARAELGAMRKCVLVRDAIAMGVDEDALDHAIEKSKEDVIELILGKLSLRSERTDAPLTTQILEAQSPRGALARDHRNLSEESTGVQAKKPQNAVLTTAQITHPKELDEDMGLTIQIGNHMASVSANDGVCAEKVFESDAFKEWVNTIAKEGRIEVSKIHFQSLDMAGSKVGFSKFQVDARVNGTSFPSTVVMRGGAVVVFVVFHYDGCQFALVVRQASVSLCLQSLAELPNGLLDSDGSLTGIAATALKEQAHIEIKESNLVDMTSLTYRDKCPGVYLSCEGSDEYARILLYEKTLSSDEFERLNRELSAEGEDGVSLTLQIVRLESLWRITADAKVLAALSLYQRLGHVGLVRKHGEVQAVTDA